jgi:hypothetical protein
MSVELEIKPRQACSFAVLCRSVIVDEAALLSPTPRIEPDALLALMGRHARGRLRVAAPELWAALRRNP